MTLTSRAWLVALALFLSMPTIQAMADSTVKVKLVSADAMVEVDGTATLQGQNLRGHLIGDGSDVVLTGLVKNRSVSVDLTGRIVPSCNLNRQSMEGVGVNDHAQTSIDMTFQCSSKAGSFGGGADYRFRLDLTLPQPPLYTPSQSDTGQSASLE